VKAKKRKPPDARVARVQAMPAVGCSCIFDKRYFRSLPSHSNCGMTLKGRWGYSRKWTRGGGQKQKFVSSKAGCSKRIAYFCTCRQTLRSGQLLM